MVVNEGQNIFDASIFLYGSVEGVFNLLIDNEIQSLDSFLVAGQVLEAKSSPVNDAVFDFILSRGLNFNTNEFNPFQVWVNENNSPYVNEEGKEYIFKTV